MLGLRKFIRVKRTCTSRIVRHRATDENSSSCVWIPKIFCRVEPNSFRPISMLHNRLRNDNIDSNNEINYLDLQSHSDDVRGVRTTVKSRLNEPDAAKTAKNGINEAVCAVPIENKSRPPTIVSKHFFLFAFYFSILS